MARRRLAAVVRRPHRRPTTNRPPPLRRASAGALATTGGQHFRSRGGCAPRPLCCADWLWCWVYTLAGVLGCGYVCGRPLARPPSVVVWGEPGGRPGVGARRCPTLPYPGGCSTIGAGSLSFRVRNGAGRWLSRCDHRDVCWVVCCWWPGSRTRACVWVGGVGRETAWWTRAECGCGGWCLCRPISTGRLAGPCGSSTSGLSTQWSAGGLPPLVWCGYLILRLVSRLDAFSGYPSRT